MKTTREKRAATTAAATVTTPAPLKRKSISPAISAKGKQKTGRITSIFDEEESDGESGLTEVQNLVTESEGEECDENDVIEIERSAPAEVKTLQFQYNEMKEAVKQAENMQVNVSIGLADVITTANK